MNGQNLYEENLQNVLGKYDRDMVASVKDGKVDPVIGRTGFELSKTVQQLKVKISRIFLM